MMFPFTDRSRSLSGIDFVVREINKLRTGVRLQVIDSSSKICSLRHPPRAAFSVMGSGRVAFFGAAFL